MDRSPTAACHHDSMIGGQFPRDREAALPALASAARVKRLPVRLTSQSPCGTPPTETHLFLSRRRGDREIEISVGKWFLAQCVVPPFLVVVLEAVRQHHVVQQGAVMLSGGRNRSRVDMRFLVHAIEPRAEIKAAIPKPLVRRSRAI